MHSPFDETDKLFGAQTMGRRCRGEHHHGQTLGNKQLSRAPGMYYRHFAAAIFAACVCFYNFADHTQCTNGFERSFDASPRRGLRGSLGILVCKLPARMLPFHADRPYMQLRQSATKERGRTRDHVARECKLIVGHFVKLSIRSSNAPPFTRDLRD